jgi:hypothetical protein
VGSFYATKNRPICLGGSYFFQVCFFLSVTILTRPTTSGLSFVRRRRIIRLMTISSRCMKFISGFLSYRVPAKAVNKKAARLGGLCFFSKCNYFLTLTVAIPTINWSLRIRTEIITIRMRLVRRVCMICLRFRPIIGRFRNKSRAKPCKSIVFIES